MKSVAGGKAYDIVNDFDGYLERQVNFVCVGGKNPEARKQCYQCDFSVALKALSDRRTDNRREMAAACQMRMTEPFWLRVPVPDLWIPCTAAFGAESREKPSREWICWLGRMPENPAGK